MGRHNHAGRALALSIDRVSGRRAIADASLSASYDDGFTVRTVGVHPKAGREEARERSLTTPATLLGVK